jgi:predicted O-methyltransferase YrrM
MMELVRHHLRRAFWSYLRHGAQYRRDAWAMQALAPLASPYLPWTYFAMRPSGVVAILNDIAVNRRTHIVECGAGVSTLYIGRLLRERGGHLHTVEESAGWAETLKAQVAREGLTEWVSIIHAPIGAIRRDNQIHPWYSPEALSSLTTRREIDLLVVDGPVAERVPNIRYPALPYFHPSLEEGATVIVDDIDRLGEQQIVRRWEHELGLRFERRYLNGIAVASIVPAANAAPPSRRRRRP